MPNTNRLVILAAGMSSRMTASLVPGEATGMAAEAAGTKSMIGVGPGGRPLLDYIVANARSAGLDDITIVVNERDQLIRGHYASGQKASPAIRFAIQRIPAGRNKPLGTADAVEQAMRSRQDWAGSSFLVCNSDNLYSIRAFDALASLDHPGGWIDYDIDGLGFGIDRVAQFGITEVDTDGYLTGIVEKPDAGLIETIRSARGSVRVTMNIWRFQYDTILPFLEAVPLHPTREEKELPEAVRLMVARYPRAMRAVSMSEAVPDLTRAEDIPLVSAHLERAKADEPPGDTTSIHGGTSSIRGEPRSLSGRFAEMFGATEPWLAFAPGRVNIIGEHTDYSGYPVLPMAINRSIRVAFAPRDDGRIEIRNIDPRFPDHAFTLQETRENFGRGDWGNYVKAALRGCTEEILEPGCTPTGFNALYESDLPVAAGLSSSSALVVVTALAFLAVNNVAWRPLSLAETLARAERHTGTQGGGMDQAVSLLGRSGHAVCIDFFPLRADVVPIPPGWSFVVSNSLVPAPKSADVQHIYNTRVLECRIAAAMIARWYGRAFSDVRELRLADVDPAALGVERREFLDNLDRVIPGGALSFDEIRHRCGGDVAEAVAAELERTVTMPDGRRGPFHVRARYTHVLAETERVRAAVEALRDGDIGTCGALLDASHASCRDLYGVSSPRLEELVRAAKESGAVGSRLTGAGFGGCTVNLVRSEEAKRLIDGIEERFYRHAPGRDGYAVADRLFIAEASPGARIVTPFVRSLA